jgi:hypothetical protein
MDFLDNDSLRVEARAVVDSKTVSFWVVLTALAIGVAIAWLGITALRAASSGPPREEPEVEDVEELDVYLLCPDCGTEFQVTRLGELQIPRHCGEPMEVIHRPRTAGG